MMTAKSAHDFARRAWVCLTWAPAWGCGIRTLPIFWNMVRVSAGLKLFLKIILITTDTRATCWIRSVNNAIVMHGVSMSIGNSDPLDMLYLQKLKKLSRN
jgi:hypothetical protein